jgi:hypothetical protein
MVTLLCEPKLSPADKVNVPAGISTKVLAGADAIAELIDVAVTVVPALTVLHDVVTHCVRASLI